MSAVQESLARPGEESLCAIVLAGGDGTRLSGLTRGRDGVVVPKQYCSLAGGPTLLQLALERGAELAGPERTSVVVARDHRRWWSDDVRALAPHNVYVQPENRGTAIGILLGLLGLMEHRPHARVVLLPADHFIEDEALLRRSILEADLASRLYPDDLVLVGMTPEWPDPELGYILPGTGRNALLPQVERFVEKPPLREAERLLALGALWNAFIVLAPARALFEAMMRRMPDAVELLRRTGAWNRCHDARDEDLAAQYRRLPQLDFSRDVLEHEGPRLRVARAPQCGWTDLGTPSRLSETLRRYRHERYGDVPGRVLVHPMAQQERRPVLMQQLRLTDAGVVPRALPG